MPTLIVLGILAAVLVYGIAVYNRFIALRNQSDESWSGIDVQLKRRYDLIPNLVETVKGYAAHESKTLEKVIQARNSALGAQGVDQKARAEDVLGGALKSIFALSESYPELKANQNFIDLQRALHEVEDHLQNARRYYNAVVRDLNTLCETFPSVLVASAFGFQRRAYFEIAATERENVKVSFVAGQ